MSRHPRERLEQADPPVGAVLKATVTPLASIFGSGFLIIVPILERTLGALAVVGAVAISALAWLVGTAIRHVVTTVEPLAERDELDRGTRRLERLGDVVILIAYVISVALYVRIMAEYMVSYAGGGSDAAVKAIGCGTIALIVGVGVTRGFGGLDWMERIALAAVLALTTVLGGAFVIADAKDALGPGLELPPVPDTGLGEMLLVLGGIVIAVQGFETVRYLGDEYDRPTRIWASRVAQAVAASIYIGFVLTATPLMGLGTDAGADADLLDITARAAAFLALPVVICATLSQFSAATADTVAAAGNLHAFRVGAFAGRRAYLLSGIVAIALVLTVSTLSIIAIASRAFAAYYAVQCVIALRTSEGVARKLAYGALAAVLLAITLFAEPAG